MHAAQLPATSMGASVLEDVCMAPQQGQSIRPYDHLLLGYLPNVASHEQRGVRELTPAMLRDILSLQALTVRL